MIIRHFKRYWMEYLFGFCAGMSVLIAVGMIWAFLAFMGYLLY